MNLDAVAEVNPDVVHDLAKPLPFGDQSFDYVLAQDILEHFTKESVVQVVAEISRVLKIGGKVEVRVPNLNDIIERFAHDEETRNEFIYGTTFETGVFGAHKVGFTPQSLVAMMIQANLNLVSFDRAETNFVAIFSKVAATKKPNKLVYVNQTLGMGGAEVFLSDLLVELQKINWQIVVYTNSLQFAQLLKTNGIKAEIIPTVVDIVGDWRGLVKGIFLWPKLLFNYWRIAIAHRDAGLYLLSGFIEKILFSPLANLIKKPVCWIEFGPMDVLYKKFFQLPKVLYFLVKSLPQQVITSSYHSRKSLTSVSRISLAKLRVIACGRNLKLHSVSPTMRSDKIVCVSRLEAGKGQDLLIAAFAILAKKYPRLSLSIVGEGDFLPTLKKIVSKFKLEHRVDFLGRVDSSLQEMQKSEVVVFPSVWPLEGFGLVMIEAMSLGKPVVAFDRGPSNEVLRHEFSGLLAKDGDVESLAEQIERLIIDNNLSKKLGKNAQYVYRQKYQIASVASQYSQVFLEALAVHKAQNDLMEN